MVPFHARKISQTVKMDLMRTRVLISESGLQKLSAIDLGKSYFNCGAQMNKILKEEEKCT
jgi:hypothetical protein